MKKEGREESLINRELPASGSQEVGRSVEKKLDAEQMRILAEEYDTTEKTIKELLREGVLAEDVEPVLEIREHLCVWGFPSVDRQDKLRCGHGNRPSILALITAYRVAGKNLDILEKIADYSGYLVKRDKASSATKALIRAFRLYETYGERMFVDDLGDLESGLNLTIAEQRQGGCKKRPSIGG